MTLKEKIIDYIRASFTLMYIESGEEDRVERIVGSACSTAVNDKPIAKLFSWEEGVGMSPASQELFDSDAFDLAGIKEATQHLDQLLAFLATTSEAAAMSNSESCWARTVVFVKDLHYMFANPNPVMYRDIRRFARAGKEIGMMLVVVGPSANLPTELRHDFVTMECGLPTREDLSIQFTALAAALEAGGCDALTQSMANPASAEELVNAACGMTENEAAGAITLSLVQHNLVVPKFVADKKVASIAASGFLEIWEPESISAVGGLEELKADLEITAKAFTKEAKEFGIAEPKGILIAGVPGSGKSLTARAAASIFNRPLLKFSIDRVFGSLVGQSEGNMRLAIKTAEACAPCVLLVEEIEKGFSGTGSSNDGGTTMRVFDSFLQWLQFKTAEVYVVATANRVQGLPPELLRKGRFDEIFFADLPTDVERRAIWEIHLRKIKRDPELFNVEQLVEKTDGFSGSEIEQAVHDGLRMAFADGSTDLTDSYLMKSISRTKPLSVTRSEDIKAMREHGKVNFRPASGSPVQKKPATFKHSAKRYVAKG